MGEFSTVGYEALGSHVFRDDFFEFAAKLHRTKKEVITMIGVAKADLDTRGEQSALYAGTSAEGNGIWVLCSDGEMRLNDFSPKETNVDAYDHGDVIAVSYARGELRFWKNGHDLGVVSTDVRLPLRPYVCCDLEVQWAFEVS